jgi:hypothetical protein
MAEDPSTPPATTARPTNAIWNRTFEEAAEANRRRQEEGSPSDYLSFKDYGLSQQNHYVFYQSNNTGPSFSERVQTSPQVTQSPNLECRQYGHKWRGNGQVDFGRLDEYVCERCNMTRHVQSPWATGPNPTGMGKLTHEQAAEILGQMGSKTEPRPKVGWICFYCGDEFEGEDDLLDHEDDCAES